MIVQVPGKMLILTISLYMQALLCPAIYSTCYILDYMHAYKGWEYLLLVQKRLTSANVREFTV